MAHQSHGPVAVGDQFKLATPNGPIFEVIKIREMAPVDHALITKVRDTKSPTLISIHTLLDRDFYIPVPPESRQLPDNDGILRGL
ncbi:MULTISPECIES: hypothetical protein [Thalassospira]|jgi:hypothetical protein|uniref:hypothetical protein n=1 Tax=Thalassospira TaxID=168934 RepID=UPI000C42D3E3|nr:MULTISPECIES: hypothetical protein [Thalassospira]MBC44661.1 hypothetical protein [Thalassospira sp.]MBO6808615.1 hypothetical protein [Thalassospira sp.]MBO6839687.1 hypothetical protein [Thalassospira sp.]MBS8274541.1 hypothetical protein [Thalassospira tepidiphila]HAI28027.1 hypothetical protein [Thalassospira sp.]|tara:strand:- start:3152 stop:3406 length:255 start_codon:yes stop_codon:yes gene_type:complete